MGTVIRLLAVASTMVVGLASCQTADEQLIEGGAVPLTQAEATAHVSGNTEIWTKGGGYYSPDGTLQVKWKGRDGSGTWEVTQDGKVCYVVDIWGGTRDCHTYVNDGGAIKLVYKGNARVAEIRSGNQLESL